MLAFRESLGNRTTTTRAILGSAFRVNRHKQSTSFLGFVLKHMQELRPSGICHALAHVAAAQPIDVQVLDDDKAILLTRFEVLAADTGQKEALLRVLSQRSDGEVFFGGRIKLRFK